MSWTALDIANTSGLDQIVIDEEVADTVLADRVKGRLPEVPVRYGRPPDPDGQDGACSSILYLKHYKGRFLRFCPGTSLYNCCGYRIIHIGENCPLSCSYCILKAYFQDNVLKVWANQDDLYQELEQAFAAQPERLFRVGTGEFTDSLALEPLTAYSRDLLRFLQCYENVCLELKTKTVDLSWTEAVWRADRVLPAWSLNAPAIAAQEERGTAPLEARLQAAAECAARGFRVCLHFDPIIRYPGWQQGYAEIVEMIFDYLRPQDIAYLSLGSFRCMPDLFRYIRQAWPESTYIFDEFVLGRDKKLRLLRPLRIEQLRFVARRLQERGVREQLYMCMESDEVWKAVFGTVPADFGGLSRHLKRLAFPDRRLSGRMRQGNLQAG
jgi:spore photoproduct lyase